MTHRDVGHAASRRERLLHRDASGLRVFAGKGVGRVSGSRCTQNLTAQSVRRVTRQAFSAFIHNCGVALLWP